LANLSPDSGNLVNFKTFGYKYLVWRFGEFLPIFSKHLSPNYLVWPMTLQRLTENSRG